MSEVIFQKYQSRGADYHWQQINRGRFFAYNSFVMARYRCYLRELDRIVRGRSHGATVQLADFGCGTGTLLSLLNRHLKKKGLAVEAHGVDIQPEAIEAGKKLFPNGHLRCESVYETTWPADSFDAAIAADVIEHVQEPARLVREMLRVITPQGFAIIGTPVRWTEKPQDTMHVHEFFPEELAQLCREAGADVVRHQFSHNIASFLRYQKKTRLLGRSFTLGRYALNALDLWFGRNVFFNSSSSSEGKIYQYIILKRK